MKTVFTTGQIAAICRVAPRTVTKWIDSGRLKGYRIPGSQDRRVPREDLITFLKANRMPTGSLEEEHWCGVLLVGTDVAFTNRVRAALPPEDWFRVHRTPTLFEAGIMVVDLCPAVVVVDFGVGREDAVAVARHARRDDRLTTTLIIALVAEDEVRPDALNGCGFNEVLKRPFDETLLYDRIRRLAEARRAAK